ncbi:MAG: class I SAM-dependent methyltransferase [Candidatus Omnitrophica bacterium]|nr:class I SAM-dependent methyltransferase [Candidatus Omnitrophota bacterium]
MKRRLKDNVYLFFAILIIMFIAVTVLILTKTSAMPITLSTIFLFIILSRTAKLIKREILQYQNGPQRFCEGKGIEIGSGGCHNVKGSMLVDIVNNFSDKNSYKVDYQADAHHLPGLPSASLDYVCASHVLEHLTNPIKAILEWTRILKPGGVIWLRIPDKRKTFDRTRNNTRLSHLIEDYEHNVPADDPTHIEDCNKNSTPPRNESHPYIHNHVWVFDDIIELFSYIKEKAGSIEILDCSENTCKNAQDFWIAARKR